MNRYRVLRGSLSLPEGFGRVRGRNGSKLHLVKAGSEGAAETYALCGAHVREGSTRFAEYQDCRQCFEYIPRRMAWIRVYFGMLPKRDQRALLAQLAVIVDRGLLPADADWAPKISPDPSDEGGSQG